MKFRLQFSVAIAFTVLTVIVLGVAVAVFYVSNRNLAIETARDAMADARDQTNTALYNIVEPVARTVFTAAKFLETFPKAASSVDGLSVIGTEIDGLDQIYSTYFGIEAEGNFYQVVQLPDELTVFGPADQPLPAGARQVMRIIQPIVGDRIETYTYLSGTGQRLATEIGPGVFDPRQRPWYAVAQETEGLAVSPIYTFESTGQPGLTLSRRVNGSNGDLIGVAGADMSLHALSEQLDAIRIGEEGEVFLLDREGALITQSNGAGDAAHNPVTEAAIARWQESGDTFFSMTIPNRSGTYIVSVEELSPIYGISPRFGIVVPAREFVGAIVDATRRVLAISGAIVLVAILATVLMARILSRNLRLVSEEARRISAFELSGEFNMSSMIVEVNELETAIANMKNSLRSFGAYVPKDLVRSIVSSGTQVSIGGTARELTILFSDIEGFTHKTEGLAPEAVMRDLSMYFDGLQAEISSRHGIVDKYIGDAVMALWNAPEEDTDHVANACHAVLACRRAEQRLNENCEGTDLFPTRTRFGLHSDTVVVGNVGSERRLQYTAIGGAVNLASRVEALNKVYGTDILVTQTIVERTGNRFVFRPVDMVSPAGTTRPVGLFELIGVAPGEPGADRFGLSEPQKSDLEAWSACHALYTGRDWHAALTALQALRPRSARKKLVDLYIDRCERFIQSPPPEDWDGVQTYDRK